MVNSLFDFTCILFWFAHFFFILMDLKIFVAFVFLSYTFFFKLFWDSPSPLSTPPLPLTHTHTELNSDSNNSCVEVGSLLLQDAIDLFLGNHIVEETEGLATRSPLAVQRDWKFYAVSTLTDLGPYVFIMYSLHCSETPLTHVS